MAQEFGGLLRSAHHQRDSRPGHLSARETTGRLWLHQRVRDLPALAWRPAAAAL